MHCIQNYCFGFVLESCNTFMHFNAKNQTLLFAPNVMHFLAGKIYADAVLRMMVAFI
jgi:hypothetical protein